ncbi:MAG TPA: type II toxin-antitoxin system VapC family toxin [Terriglobales bacterium]|nr:type II toxin-antitoxin system VapC family toxin [Terriglobales bacterium]
MIILDTNVLSALMRTAPEPKVVAWLDNQPQESVWITSITVLEVRFGLEILPASKKRTALFRTFNSLLDTIGHRIAGFDAAAAESAADLMARRRKAGRPVELRDTMIAGIALARRASLATRNVSHFADASISVIDPWAD